MNNTLFVRMGQPLIHIHWEYDLPLGLALDFPLDGSEPRGRLWLEIQGGGSRPYLLCLV